MKISYGSPKKKAAWLSFEKKKGGISPGFVIAHQKTKMAARSPHCQMRILKAFA